MISKLNRIKGLGLVFGDFTWATTTPGFKNVNLVYGWNGCGKTTLTRLFDAVAANAPGTLEYEFEDHTGAKYRQGEAFSVPIRVFNQEYVQNNVRILESNANTISVLLGEDNQELVAAIAADEQDLNGDAGDPTKPGKIFEARAVEQKRRRKERENETAFTDIAKAIGAAIIGSGSASRNYRSPNAKTDFEKLTAPSALTAEALRVEVLSLRQELLPEIPLLTRPTEDVGRGIEDTLEVVRGCLGKGLQLLGATVEAETITRLTQNSDIAEWVEQGHCHCRACQRLSGAPFVSAFSVPAASFSHHGEVGQFQRPTASGNLVTTSHCAGLRHPDFRHVYGEHRNGQRLRDHPPRPAGVPAGGERLSEAVNWIDPPPAIFNFQTMPPRSDERSR